MKLILDKSNEQFFSELSNRGDVVSALRRFKPRSGTVIYLKDADTSSNGDLFDKVPTTIEGEDDEIILINLDSLVDDRALHDFIEANPNYKRYFCNFEEFDAIKELRFRDRLPFNLIFDMLKVGFKNLSNIGKLSIMQDDQIRSSLIPIFESVDAFRYMPNTLEEFSKYPTAIECLSLVEDLEARMLIIIFPGLISLDNCAIALGDIPPLVGGWRTEAYAQLSGHFNLEAGVVKVLEELITEDKDFRYRMVLDQLWVKACETDEYLMRRSERNRSSVVKSIVEEMTREQIYAMLRLHIKYDPQVLIMNDEQERDMIVWKSSLESYPLLPLKSPNTQVIKYLLINKLFPNYLTLIALANCLDYADHHNHKRYVDNLFDKRLSEHRIELGRETVMVLSELFEVEIDTRILDKFRSSVVNFDDFIDKVYETVKTNILEQTSFIGLMTTYQTKYQTALFRFPLFEAMESMIISKYSKSAHSMKAFIIKQLFKELRGLHPGEYLSNLGGISKTSTCLNTMYRMAKPKRVFSEGFSNYFMEIYKGKDMSDKMEEVNEMLNLEGFGLNFLGDLRGILNLTFYSRY